MTFVSVSPVVEGLDTFFCNEPCSKYGHLCTKEFGHEGRCSYKFAAKVIETFSPRAYHKALLDTYKTPGDCKSVKNRADRCFPEQLTSKQIKILNEQGKKGVGIRRRFSSTPRDCQKILFQLVTQIMNISGFTLDLVDDELKATAIHLQNMYGVQHHSGLECRICKEKIEIEQFEPEHSEEHNRIQIGHIVPPGTDEETAHEDGNCQWIHRWCNLIQSDNTEEDTFKKLEKILHQHGRV